MLILGIDTSAVCASCAVCETGENPHVIVSGSINNKLTHSQTLVPLMESLMKSGGLSFDDIDAFAVTNGPGSFTGLRIGVSAIKGIAFAQNKPCIPVSALEGLAHNLCGRNCIACAVMDARCAQVYTALFRISGNNIERLCEDKAVAIADLAEELRRFDEDIVFVGDGAELTAKSISGRNISVAPPLLRYQNAVSVCFAAGKGEEISAKQLMPSYLRLPQAERERLSKENAKGSTI